MLHESHGAAVVETEIEDGDFPANLAKLPAMPTDAPPGSAWKLSVMEERAARREQLHHPCDAKHEGDTVPGEFRAADSVKRAEMLALRQVKGSGFSMFFGAQT